MSDEGRVVPSNMMQDVMPKHVTAFLDRGSRYMVVMKTTHRRTQRLAKMVNEPSLRAE